MNDNPPGDAVNATSVPHTGKRQRDECAGGRNTDNSSLVALLTELQELRFAGNLENRVLMTSRRDLDIWAEKEDSSASPSDGI